jgi:hypothetical protein
MATITRVRVGPRVIRHPAVVERVTEPGSLWCHRCGQGLTLPHGPDNYPNFRCGCGTHWQNMARFPEQVVERRTPPYVEVHCTCGETHSGSPWSAADIVCERTKQVWNSWGQPLDWGALFGCVHYRRGWDCDCHLMAR